MFKYHAALLILILLAVVRLCIFCSPNILICPNREDGLATFPMPKFFTDIRNNSARIIRSNFPSPHSELLEGMLLGIDDLDKTPRYNDVLKTTGTVHVVVVSGYNISLVYGIVIKLIGTKYKFKNLFTAQVVTLLYSLLSGFEPPVIRSWIMGSIAAWGQYSGRSIEAARLLVFSGVIMILIDPNFLFSVSFQLSFLATLSLVSFSSAIKGLFDKLKLTKVWLLEDLCTTLAAQVLVWPVISMTFGRVSLISSIVNPLILWTVPISTIFGGIYLFSGLLVPSLAKLLSVFVYLPLDVFVTITDMFAKIPHASIDLKLTYPLGFLYFGLLIFLGIYRSRINTSKKLRPVK